VKRFENGWDVEHDGKDHRWQAVSAKIRADLKRRVETLASKRIKPRPQLDQVFVNIDP
jgi:hypothetical protein